jgi:hypothetical protein
MQALPCGADDNAEVFANLTPDYKGATIKSPPLGRYMKPDLGTETSASGALGEEVAQGIHLHWTLPAAFLHVRPEAGDKVQTTIPALTAPNRWAVIRLWCDATSGLLAKSCIVESDFIPGEKDPPEDGAPWIVKQDSSMPYYRDTTIGRAVPVDGETGWTESRTDRDQTFRLTAFAPANPGFAAFYPSCRNVFGFHDDATGLKGEALPDKTLFTYLVAGWFSRNADDRNIDDPLDQLVKKTRLDWIARMRELEWEISPDILQLPTYTICYAFIGGVKWEPKQPPQRIGDFTKTVALGNGLLETVAALTDRQAASEDLAGRLRDQLQFCTLRSRRVARADLSLEGQSSLFNELRQFGHHRTRLHERTFSAEPGGKYWEIVRADNNSSNSNATPEAIVNLPANISKELGSLNKTQRWRDEVERHLAGMRRQLFAAWHNYELWLQSAAGLSPDETRNLLARVRAGTRNIESYEDILKKSGEDLATSKRKLANFLRSNTARDLLGACRLADRQMPRFWRPNDPFVLLSGIKVPEIQAGRTPLKCRVSNQTFSFRDPTPHGSGAVRILIGRDELEGDSIVKNLLPETAKVPSDVRALLLDVLFAAGITAAQLASIYCRRIYGAQADAPVIRQRQTAIETLQRNVLAAAGNIRRGLEAEVSRLPLRCDGADPDLARLSFVSACNEPTIAEEQVFVPVFVVWKVEWRHGLPVQDNWELIPDNYDLTRAHKDAPERPIKARYEGFTIIARNLERGFKGDGPEYVNKKFPDYAPVFDRLSGLVGQSLAGLNDAMGMLDCGAQFPPPAENTEALRQPDDRDIKEAVGHQYGMAPLEADDECFSPIRGGELEFTKLCLVDTFGRVCRVIDKDKDKERDLSPGIRLAHTLRGSSQVNIARLPPRLLQPSRLLFRWVSSDDDSQESLGDLRTSPICGWIMHSHVDRGLLVFQNNGHLLGMIQSVLPSNGRELAAWSSLPPRRDQGAAQATDTDIANPHLRYFVNGLLTAMRREQRGSSGFGPFREFLMNHEDRSDQPQGQDLRAVLVGRPVALVRASLRLELAGPPLASHTRQQLLADPKIAETPDFLRAKFPVRLGDSRLGADGLLGYFVGGGQPSDYLSMRLSADQANSALWAAQSYFDKNPYLRMGCSWPNNTQINLTLLMDPKLGVHIVSGILPANLVMLPPGVVSAISGALQPAFLVAPALGGWTDDARLPDIPLPTNGKDEWGWYSLDAKGGAPKEPVTMDPQVRGNLFDRGALYEGWLASLPQKDERP